MAREFSLKEMADLLTLNRSSARKYIVKLGVVGSRKVTRGSGGQYSLVYTEDAALKILRTRQTEGHPLSQRAESLLALPTQPPVAPAADAAATLKGKIATASAAGCLSVEVAFRVIDEFFLESPGKINGST